MSNFIQEVIDRRVLQAVGVYVGGSWVLVEIFDRIVDRYLLSPNWEEMVFWGLYSLLPAVALIAWTHGKPGRDKATKTEIVGVPINLIATLGLLINIAAGKDLGAVAERAEVTNEFGVTESHYIPRENFRTRMALFFWDNETGEPEYDWLQYAVPLVLTQDLSANPFVVATSPYNGNSGYYSRLQRAGIDDALNVPLSLMREIAAKSNRQYFIHGEIDKVADELLLTARIYDTSTMKMVQELTQNGVDVLPVAEILSDSIKTVLDVPSGGKRLSAVVPLTDTYGESEEVLNLYTRALNAMLFDNDFDLANNLIDAAIAIDENFVYGYLQKGTNLINQGNVQDAQVNLRKAQTLDYRLNSDEQAMLKFLIYRFEGQTDRVMGLLRMQVRLRDDANSHKRLANMQMFSGDIESAIGSFEAALERDQLDLDIYQSLANLKRASGDFEGAIQNARELLDKKPEELSATLFLGDLLRDSGNSEEAREIYEQAQYIDPGAVAPPLRLSIIAERTGQTQKANDYLLEAEQIAVTPQQQSSVVQAKIRHAYRFGQIQQTLDLLEEEYLIDQQFMPPLQLAFNVRFRQVAYLLEVDRIEEAEAILTDLESGLQPPFNEFSQMLRAQVHTAKGEYDEAEAAIDRMVQIIEQFQAQYMQFQVEVARAVIAHKKEDYDRSSELMGSAIKLVRSSILGEELHLVVPNMLAGVAQSQILAGQLDAARISLQEGFELDENEPKLWVERARLQFTQNQPDLAFASIQSALAIWKNADPDYKELVKAKELAAEIETATL